MKRYHETVANVFDHWRRHRVNIGEAASEKTITQFEQKIGVRLPDELRYLYAQADGMANGDSDNSLFHFWPLDEIIKCNGIDLRDDGGIEIAFADFMIDSYRYLVVVDGRGNCLGVRVDFEQKMLTSSLADFLQVYVQSPDKVYL